MPRHHLALYALAALSTLSGPARADALDTARPARVFVGPPAGLAPTPRIDGAQTGRTHTALPGRLVEQWSRRLGGVDSVPVVTEAGTIIALTVAREAMAIKADGRYVWRSSIGLAPATTSPALLSDGTVVVVTLDDELLGLAPSGEIAFRKKLGQPWARRSPTPLALSTGGVVVGRGTSISMLGGDGSLVARADLGDVVDGELVDLGDGSVVFHLEDGYRYRWSPPNRPQRLVSRRGPAGYTALVDPNTLVAAHAPDELLFLDARSGKQQASYRGEAIDGAIAVTREGWATFITRDEWLISVDPQGNELRKVAVGPRATLSATTGSRRAYDPEDTSPALLVDGAGKVAFVRKDGVLGVVSAEGALTVTSAPVCSAPTAILPAGERALIVACANGIITKYAE